MLHPRAVQMSGAFLPDYGEVHTVMRPVISTQTEDSTGRINSSGALPVFLRFRALSEFGGLPK